MTPEEIARACAQKMWELDASHVMLDIEMIEAGAGSATLSMRVRPDMLNGHGLCHGGFIFTLADSAFAYACNTYDVSTVAQHCSITFLASGRPGDVLIARARETHRVGRSGVYDIAIARQTGEIIAEFRGLSRTIGGAILTNGETPAQS